MSTPRGFAPLILLVIIGIAILSGAGWWATANKDASQQANQSATPQSTKNEIVPTKSVVPAAPASISDVKVSVDRREITVTYQNMPKEVASLFLCIPSGACTEWGVEFAPTEPNGTFVMKHDPSSAKTIGYGTYTIQAVDFSIPKVFATSGPFTVGPLKY